MLLLLLFGIFLLETRLSSGLFCAGSTLPGFAKRFSDVFLIISPFFLSFFLSFCLSFLLYIFFIEKGLALISHFPGPRLLYHAIFFPSFEPVELTTTAKVTAGSIKNRVDLYLYSQRLAIAPDARGWR